jgi:hypothetical protein
VGFFLSPEGKPLLAPAMPDQAHQKTTLNPWVMYFDSKLGNSQLKTTFTSLFAQEFFKNDRFVNNFSLGTVCAECTEQAKARLHRVKNYSQICHS